MNNKSKLDILDLLDIDVPELDIDVNIDISNIDLSNIDINSVKNRNIKKISRKRQDKINHASRLCRYKKKQLFILMEKHIKSLHDIISYNNLNINLIQDQINNYTEESLKIINIKQI